MKRRLAVLLLAMMIAVPAATVVAAKITPPPGPAWRVWKEGDGGTISLSTGSTQEHATIVITGTTELEAGEDWSSAVAILKALGFAEGYSQSLHWPPGVLTCASAVFCDSKIGWGTLISTSERRMLLDAADRNGMLPPFDCSCPEAQLDLQSQVDRYSASVDAILFVAAFIVDQWDLPISRKLLVDVATRVWTDAIALAERILARDWRGAADAARHLYDITADAIGEAIHANAAGTAAEEALESILKRSAKLAFIEARFVLAAATFATQMGRAYYAREDVTNYHIGEGVGGV